jgi:anti-sigma factor RsiW
MTHLNDELLDAAADGAALDHDAAQHLRICAECGAMVARLQRLRTQLAALPRVVEADADAWPQVRERIRARRVRRRVFVSAPVLALAAAVLFAVIRIGMQPEQAAPPTQTASELAELRSVVAPVVVDAMAANLTIYDAALQELEAHAAVGREDPDVRQRIDDLRRKRAALLRLASST